MTAWRFLHNAIAHPLLFFSNDAAFAVRFHDWTSHKMHGRYPKLYVRREAMTTKRNEHSGRRVSSIAARVQNIIKHFKGDYDFLFMYLGDDTYAPLHLRLKDVGALAGSVLTQSPDHPVPPLKTVKKHRYRYRNRNVLKKVKRK